MKTFKLPDLGEGLQDAEIVAWHVGAGEKVVADQPLVSVETAKAVVEVPSPWSGRVLALHAKPGDVVGIGAALVDIDTEDELRDTGTVVGTLQPIRSAEPRVLAEKTTPTAARSKMSPAVRKLAMDLGLNPLAITGSGPEGSLTRRDVEAAMQAKSAVSGFEPLRGVRRAMAETMARAAAVVAATVTDEAIIDAWPEGADPTVRLVRGIVAGCRAAPALNAWFDPAQRSRQLHDRIDLGIAMETEDGLFAPVLRNVGFRTDDDLRLGLEAMKRDIAQRTVPLAELRGQTITLSNFGMLGGLTAALTIVPPQVAILGVGRIHRAARVIDGEIRVARILPLSLTFDHRAVTGAEAVMFLSAAIKDLVGAKPARHAGEGNEQ